MKFDLAGVLCTDIFDYLPEAWEIISETLKIGKNCPIPPVRIITNGDNNETIRSILG